MANRLDKKLLITDGGGCWSYLGSIQSSVEGQRISLADGCYGRGTTLHEVMHALGIDHEQNRPDRDHFVHLDWTNIHPNKKHNYEILQGKEWIDTGHDYEYNSVMHYDGYDFAIDRSKPGKEIYRGISINLDLSDDKSEKWYSHIRANSFTTKSTNISGCCAVMISK